MSSILLIVSIAAMGLIVFWYVFDEAARGGSGKSGLLAMRDYAKPVAKKEPGWQKPSRRR